MLDAQFASTNASAWDDRPVDLSVSRTYLEKISEASPLVNMDIMNFDLNPFLRQKVPY